MFIIEEAVDAKTADQTKTALLAAIEEHDAGGFPIDLGGAEPSQIALQIGLAALKELQARSIDPMPGSFLKSVLANDISASNTGSDHEDGAHD